MLFSLGFAQDYSVEAGGGGKMRGCCCRQWRPKNGYRPIPHCKTSVAAHAATTAPGWWTRASGTGEPFDCAQDFANEV